MLRKSLTALQWILIRSDTEIERTDNIKYFGRYLHSQSLTLGDTCNQNYTKVRVLLSRFKLLKNRDIHTATENNIPFIWNHSAESNMKYIHKITGKNAETPSEDNIRK